MKQVTTLIFFLLLAGTINAQWNTDTLSRTPICTTSDEQKEPTICNGDSSSYFIFWVSNSGATSGISGQRLNSFGYKLWANSGVTIVSNLSSYPRELKSFPDGVGGAIIIYEKNVTNSTEIRAQRINKNGTILWGINGILVYGNVTNDLFHFPQAVMDEDKNLIITWYRVKPASNNSIEAQKIDTSGNVLLGSFPVSISASNIVALPYPKIVSNKAKGAYIAFEISTNTTYLQQIDSNGVLLWVTPVNLSIDQFNSNTIALSEDGFGGIYVISTKASTFPSGDIFVQHLDANGNHLFPVSGINISNLNSKFFYLKSICNSSGELIVSYFLTDATNTSFRIISNKIDAAGNLSWGSTGVISCTDTSIKDNMQMASDSSGGAFIVWADKRYSNYTFYGMHLNSNGNLLWRNNGYPVCAAPMLPFSGSTEISFSLIGRIISPVVTWTDTRLGQTQKNIYATDLYDAVTGINDISLDNPFESIYPNPTTGNFTIKFNNLNKVKSIQVFNTLGERVFEQSSSKELKEEIKLDNISTGIYFVKLFDGEKYYCKKLIVEHD